MLEGVENLKKRKGLLFSYDSIILENIYVFNHIFRLFIGIKKAIALGYSTRRV